MASTCVIQSAASRHIDWQNRCMQSVAEWAQNSGFAYQFMGDELFEMVPNAYRQKALAVSPERTPVVADLARLLWIKRLLDESSAERVLWLDADTLIFAPSALVFAPQSSCIFGEERWL